MLTQCPNCQTTFRVTSEILRVADGQVRCGRCHTQFDALQRLIDEDNGQEAQPRIESRQQPATDIEVEEPAAHEEITLEGKHIEITGTYLVLDESSQGGPPQIRQEVIEEWVEIDDEDIQPPPDERAGMEEYQAAIDALDTPPQRHDDVYDAPQTADADADPIPAPRTEPEHASDLDFLPTRTRRRSALAWKILALPLSLLLVAQLVHHYRSELARHPRLGETVVKVTYWWTFRSSAVSAAGATA